MRFNDSQKKFLLFILGIAVLVAIICYLAFVVPDIGQYVYLVVLAIAGICILYVSFLPLISYLSERADSILDIYYDESGKGIHIFSAYTVSRYKLFRPPIRYIQHYFIFSDSGKVYYKVLFSHSMAPLAGESGYAGYSSFEKNVLQSEELKNSLEVFSRRAKMNLRLGKLAGKGDRDEYSIQSDGYTIEIKKKEGTIDDFFEVSCHDPVTGHRRWGRKI